VAESTAQANVASPVTFDWSITPTGDAVDIEVVTRTTVSLTQMVWNGQRELTRRARAELPQSSLDNTERRQPKLVLALDYSGSMDLPIQTGSTARAIDVLEGSVRALLDAGLRVSY